jgi:hypothetical protein
MHFLLNVSLFRMFIPILLLWGRRKKNQQFLSEELLQLPA